MFQHNFIFYRNYELWKIGDDWILTNLNGWRITSLYNTQRIVDCPCVQKRNDEEDSIFFYVSYLGFPIYEIKIRNGEAKVWYIGKRKSSRKLISSNLIVSKFYLHPYRENIFFSSSEEVFIDGHSYRNLIGKFSESLEEDKCEVMLHSFLTHLGQENGNIKIPLSFCYKIISSDEMDSRYENITSKF